MASALTDKLSLLVKQMRGQARMTESNVQDMLREVRLALLEADVALPMVRDFIARVKDKAMGQDVVGSLTPGQALVAVVNRALALADSVYVLNQGALVYEGPAAELDEERIFELYTGAVPEVPTG